MLLVEGGSLLNKLMGVAVIRCLLNDKILFIMIN